MMTSQFRLDLRNRSAPSGWPPLLFALVVPNQMAFSPGTPSWPFTYAESAAGAPRVGRSRPSSPFTQPEVEVDRPAWNPECAVWKLGLACGNRELACGNREHACRWCEHACRWCEHAVGTCE